MPRQEKQQTFWQIRYSDGHVFDIWSKVNPMSHGVIHLNKEKAKGIDHGAITSIRQMPEEAAKRLTPVKNNHASPSLIENATLPATYEKEEEEEAEAIISPELDDELYHLIQSGIASVELVEKLFYKFYEFTQDKDPIFDDVFLREFCKRIARATNTVLDDILKIEDNLTGE